LHAGSGSIGLRICANPGRSFGRMARTRCTALKSLRSWMRVGIVRLRARFGVEIRTDQRRRGGAGKFCGTNVSSRTCPACATTCARLRLRVVQPQDRRSRSVGAAEGRIRAKMLSKRGKNRSRTASPAAGRRRLRSHGRPTVTARRTACSALQHGFGLVRQVIFPPYWINIVHRR
jgi:hypothetical protein